MQPLSLKETDDVQFGWMSIKEKHWNYFELLDFMAT